MRFIGDAGYVVTFRQTDPLYVVDLSDPEHPRVRGELKMLGYSAYLHPVGATCCSASARTRRSRAAAAGPSSRCSTSPTRRGRGGCTSARSRPTRTRRSNGTTAPSSTGRQTGSPSCRSTQAAAGFRVSRQGIDDRGSVSQPGTITRSAVIGGRLFTVSELGVTASPLTLSGGTGSRSAGR